jgi:hypothetical protein
VFRQRQLNDPIDLVVLVEITHQRQQILLGDSDIGLVVEGANPASSQASCLRRT